jgi:hypothetical protein
MPIELFRTKKVQEKYGYIFLTIYALYNDNFYFLLLACYGNRTKKVQQINFYKTLTNYANDLYKIKIILTAYVFIEPEKCKKCKN